ANAHGWEILCTAGFTAVWDGGRALDAVTVTPDDGGIAPALGHFGYGVLTFHVPCLFRTEAGFDLMVSGPINRPKDAIAPLTGLIETDWAPYSFTMNWQFTRPRTAVRLEKGEPFCNIMPVRRGEIEAVEPELRSLSENPELKRQHDTWTANRNRFNTDLRQRGASREVAEALPSRRHARRRSGRQRRSSHAAQGQAVQEAGSRLSPRPSSPLPALRGEGSKRLRNNIRRDLVFDAADLVAQHPFALLQALHLDHVGAERHRQGGDRGVEVAV